MEVVKRIFLGVVSLVVAIILIGAFTPVLRELGQESFIPMLWVVVIVAMVGEIFFLIKKFE